MDFFDLADKLDPANSPTQDPATPPVEDGNGVKPVDATKAFSERLNVERSRITDEIHQETAQSFGYKTWDEFQKASKEKLITDAGLEPDKVNPVIDKIVAQHPSVIAAKEQAEQTAEATRIKSEADALFAINEKFKTELTSVDDLDEATLALYKKGVPLDKAYIAEHLDDVMKSRAQSQPSKDHLQPVGSRTIQNGDVPPLTKEQIAMYKRFNPGITDEAIQKYHDSMHKK